MAVLFLLAGFDASRAREAREAADDGAGPEDAEGAATAAERT
jgi:hypothetical protein